MVSSMRNMIEYDSPEGSTPFLDTNLVDSCSSSSMCLASLPIETRWASRHSENMPEEHPEHRGHRGMEPAGTLGVAIASHTP